VLEGNIRQGASRTASLARILIRIPVPRAAPFASRRHLSSSRMTTPRTSAPAPQSVVGTINVLLRRRYLVVGFALLSGTLAAALDLARERTWISESLFMPQAKRSQSAALSGIAAQIGINIPGDQGVLSPAFVVDLIHSRAILAPAVASSYRPTGSATAKPLADVLRVRDGPPAVRRIRAERQLDRMIGTSAATKTGIVTLDVRAKDPAIAQQLNARILALVDSANQETRRSQASSERRFTEQRTIEARTELRAAENRLEQFLQANREYRNSPELSFQQDRLARDVSMRQQVYTTLSQALEQARIEEVRDTPVLSVLQAPEVPVIPEPRGLVASVITATLLGAFVGAILALIGEQLARRPRAEDPTDEFRRLVAETVGDLRGPWRRRPRPSAAVVARTDNVDERLRDEAVS